MLKLQDNPPMLMPGHDAPSAISCRWWVAHTKSRNEKALAWDFAELQIPYFLPMVQKTMIWGGRKRKVFAPIFPSYIFFCGDNQARYAAVTTNRICQVIDVKSQEQFVAELDGLYRALLNGAELDLYPHAAVGRRCKVAKGPLQGVEGVVVFKQDVLRLVLQVSLLGQGASLEITADLLEPAS